MILQIGTGILLSEYPFFMKAIEKIDPDDQLLRSLCSLLFNVTCKKHDLKKNIRLFNGFSSTTNPQDKIDKLSKNKDKWTDEMLLDICKIFGIDENGDRDVLISRLVSFLMHPTVLKEKVSVERRKSIKSSKLQGTKRKLSKAKVTSAYVLFSTATRDEVKANHPDGNFAFIAQKINDSWRSLEPDEKQVPSAMLFSSFYYQYYVWYMTSDEYVNRNDFEIAAMDDTSHGG
jgi:HMG (high mobility group) box